MTLPQDTLFPSDGEQQLWTKTKRKADNLFHYMSGVELLVSNVQTAFQFAQDNGLEFPATNLFEKYEKTFANVSAVKRAMNAVEERELAIATKGEDFDIVAPPGEIDTFNKYNVDLSGFPLIFVGVAVVVIAAVVVTVTVLWKQARSIQHESKILMREAEKEFCKDPNSAICRRWMEKESSDVQKKKGLADRIFDSLGLSGSSLGMGALIAIGIGVYFLTRRD